MDDSGDDGHPVLLHVYDYSHFINNPEIDDDVGRISRLWFSGIVIFGTEFMFSDTGVVSTKPGETGLGAPDEIQILGHTEISYPIFLEFLLALSDCKYRPGQFEITSRNTNTFCEEVVQFVCGLNLPKYLFDLPPSILNSPFAEKLLQRLQKFQLPAKTTIDCDLDDHQLHLPLVALYSRNRLRNYIPRLTPSAPHLTSSDLIELQADIQSSDSALLVEQEHCGDHDSDSDENLKTSGGVSPQIRRASSLDSGRGGGGGPVVRLSYLPKAGPKKRVTFSDQPVQVFQVSDSEDDSDLDDTVRSQEEDSEEDELPPLEEIRHPEQQITTAARLTSQPNGMSSDNENVSAIMAEPDSDEQSQTKKKSQKPSEPPVTFRDFDHAADFEDLVRTIVTLLTPDEQDRLREMEDWIIKNEGTWVLAEGFNNFLGRVLSDKMLPSEGRVAILRILAYGAGQDDFVLILHMDRKDHVIMNYAQDFDRLPILEQEALALLFANLFESNSSSEWLLYISEWSTGSVNMSNIRVTTKVAVNALLGDTKALMEYGSAIMHNLGTKEVKAVVFDDVCTELAMAIMQFWQGKPGEEYIFRTMKAMNKFCSIAHREVPQLIKMIGPEPSKFSGMSQRVDDLIQQINVRLASVPSFA